MISLDSRVRGNDENRSLLLCVLYVRPFWFPASVSLKTGFPLHFDQLIRVRNFTRSEQPAAPSFADERLSPFHRDARQQRKDDSGTRNDQGPGK